MRGYLKSPPEFVYVACLLVFMIGLVMCNAGCSSDGPARETLATAARVLKVVDAAEAEAYRLQAFDCEDQTDSIASYRSCMLIHDRIVQAEETAHHALLAVEAALDAHGDARRDGLVAAAPCAAEAFDELVDALRAADVHVPDEVADAAAFFSALAPGSCRDER